ncbi:Glyoxalase/Bleomycin resistance protein/Dihydroxybiphenyl dioxygenase [Triangularia setosa]|uniref:Glyoxalase/Bleomycin resistance protein/Dihydroxybiphenyl dioxygenase n=1 Tax=Triangularia setosa TaxID=2587417 RepID=A0AAN6W2Q3_9PEZI|nr:Glyoxalase/Bleomycin resistance protein/Dihydroxybiphenyl dioxygenase [Podospora setosa]
MPAQAVFRDSITKFSAKPPGHDAARQRENQRRHRARVKERICDLEAALASTQSKLDDALKQIEELNAEICRLWALSPSAHKPSGSTPRMDARHVVADLPVIEESIETAMDSTTTPTSAILNVSHSPHVEPGLSYEITASLQSTTGIEDSNSDCPSLPPPRPGESTIACRDAYTIIKDRNPPDLDSEIMNQWLKPGFRRAIIPGSGCRVETHLTQMTHLNPLGHVSLGVRDYTISRAFYTAILAPLNLRLVYDSGPLSDPSAGKVRTLGYGPDEDHELLNIFEYQDATSPGPGFHLAFNAPSRQAVIDFHTKAIELGGTDNGAPGIREHYGKNYFAAFVVDPNGWKLEAVCKVPPEQEQQESSET